jgi:hypothetical protein
MLLGDVILATFSTQLMRFIEYLGMAGAGRWVELIARKLIELS